jgi:integrase/recombinase XerD
MTESHATNAVQPVSVDNTRLDNHPSVPSVSFLHAIRWDIYPRVAAVPSAREWLQLQAHRQLSARTVDTYGRSLEDLLAFCSRTSPPIGVETATRVELGSYINDLATRPNPHGQQLMPQHAGVGMANQTIQLRITVARLYYDHLVALGVRTTNPIGRSPRWHCFGPARPASDEIPPTSLFRRRPAPQPWIPSDADFAQILAALNEEPIRTQALVLLLYDGALRREEAVLLKLPDIDWPHRELTLRPEICKNASGRLVVFTPPTAQRLRAYLERRRQIRHGIGALFLSESDRNHGQGLSPAMVNKLVHAIAAHTDLPNLHPHTFRHLRLTHMARCGVPEHVIASYAGHRSLETTRLYLHMSGRDISSVVTRRMEELDAWVATSLGEQPV